MATRVPFLRLRTREDTIELIMPTPEAGPGNPAGLLGTIDRYLRMFTSHPDAPGLSPEEARKKAMENLGKLLTRKEVRSTGKEVDRPKLLLEESQVFTKNMRSGKRDHIILAENDIKADKIQVKFAAEGTVLVKAAYEVAHRRGDAPSWLLDTSKNEGIKFSAPAAELAMRMAVLPKDLREDPYVMYRLLRHMERSIDYHAEHSTNAILEAKMIRDRMVSHIQERVSELSVTNKNITTEFRGFESDDVFSPTFDLYRLKKLERPEEAGEEPDDEKEHEAWEARKQAMNRYDDLDNDLGQMQKVIDGKLWVSIEDEYRQLGDFQKKLIEGGYTRGGKVAYNTEAADEYIERIHARREVVDANKQMFEEQKRAQQQSQQEVIYKLRKDEDRNERIKEMRKQGAAVEWTKELAARFPHAKAEIGEVIHVRDFKPEWFDTILSGEPDAIEHWFSEFWQDIVTGSEIARPDLTEMMQWQGFMKLMDVLSPGEWQHYKFQFETQWKEVVQIDSVVKAFFTAGDTKEKSRAWAALKPQHMAWLFRNFKWSEYTYSLTKKVTMDRLNRRMEDFFEKADFVRGPLNPDEISLLERSAPDLLRRLEAETRKLGVPITRDRLLKGLQGLYAERDSNGTLLGLGKLDGDLNILMWDIQLARNKAGRGVYLRDFDIGFNSSGFQEISELHKEYGLNQETLTRGTRLVNGEFIELTPQDRTALVERQGKLGLTLNEKWQKFTELPGESRTYNNKDLTAIRGYSPIEIEVRERLLPFLRKELIDTKEIPDAAAFDKWLEKNEWQVRNAIIASRYASVGWGDILDIGARVTRAPVLDLDTEVTSVTGADVMPAGIAEPFTRILNDNWFRDRFSIGGDFGNEAYDYYYQNMFQRQEPDFWKNMRPETKRKIEALRKEGKPAYKTIIQEAEYYFKIPYTELLRPGYHHSGAHMSNSYWRPQTGMLEPYWEKMLERAKTQPGGKDWIINNQALSLQFAMSDLKNLPARMQGIERMMARTPSQIFNILGRDLSRIVGDQGMKVNSPQWYRFQIALSNAEMEVWKDQEGLNVRPLDFTNPADATDFDTVLRPHLESVGIADPVEQEKLRTILIKARKFVNTADESGKTVLEKWAKHMFPLTLPIIDFNVKNADVGLLGAYSNERRINDINGMGAAMGQEFALFKPENMSPPTSDDTKYVEELYKYRDMINSYDSTEVAELAAAGIDDTFGYMNIDRSMYNIIGWIPFSKQIMRGLAETDMRWIKGTKDSKFMNRITYGNWEHLAQHDLAEWPHTVANGISLSVKYLGGHARSLNPNEWASHVATVQARGMYINLRDLPKEAVSKYGAGAAMRYFYHLPRRMWWLPIAGGISVGLVEARNDQKKEEGH